MTGAGPAGVLWPVALLLWAAGAVVLGELVRGLAARWVPSWRDLERIERLLISFYLGGALMYLVAALPIGAFVLPVLVALPLGAAVLVVLRELRARGPAAPGPGPEHRFARPRPAAVLALLVALALFGYEAAIAAPIATGNTFDSSLLTTWVAILLGQHSLPLSYRPFATAAILYPQGTTVWLGWAQALLGLPPARTSLLVTPLFLGLAPLGAFVLGRRAFRSDVAAIGAAVFFAAIVSWTRVLVSGSNDFALAFPLVLVLLGQAIDVSRGPLPRWSDTIAFGVLLGYSAALNPVGAQWLLPTILVVGLVAWARSVRAAGRWLARWAVLGATAALALIPSLYVLVQGRSEPLLASGTGIPPPGTTWGIDRAGFVGGIDPYLFGPNDVWLSPIPVLRAELALLLTAGLAILVLLDRSATWRAYFGPFRRFVIAGAAVVIAALGILWAASTGWGPGIWFAQVSSAEELSIWLFTLYGLIALLPLLVVLESLATAWRRDATVGPPSTPTPRPRIPRLTAPVAVAVALVVVLPGVALTATSLPPVLTQTYTNLGNVTSDDFAMLAWAGGHLPAGARVLVAPGSAAEFLPGYASNVVMLYPMLPGFRWINASYSILLTEVPNGTLDPGGAAALAALDVEYIAVTGPNSVLWPPFSPAPFLADPAAYPVVFHAGDAYLFERTA